jgi:hypothetical protein
MVLALPGCASYRALWLDTPESNNSPRLDLPDLNHEWHGRVEKVKGGKQLADSGGRVLDVFFDGDWLFSFDLPFTSCNRCWRRPEQARNVSRRRRASWNGGSAGCNNGTAAAATHPQRVSPALAGGWLRLTRVFMRAIDSIGSSWLQPSSTLNSRRVHRTVYSVSKSDHRHRPVDTVVEIKNECFYIRGFLFPSRLAGR